MAERKASEMRKQTVKTRWIVHVVWGDAVSWRTSRKYKKYDDAAAKVRNARAEFPEARVWLEIETTGSEEVEVE